MTKRHTYISLSDIALDSKHIPSVIQVTIKQSKTDPFRQGVQLCLGKTDKEICPVNAIRQSEAQIVAPFLLCKMAHT